MTLNGVQYMLVHPKSLTVLYCSPCAFWESYRCTKPKGTKSCCRTHSGASTHASYFVEVKHV